MTGGSQGRIVRRSPAASVPPAHQQATTHHCWVEPADAHDGPWPGLVIEWRRGPFGWLALVVYVVHDKHTVTTMQRWVAEADVRPATGGTA